MDTKEFMPKGIKGFQKGHSVPVDIRAKMSKARMGKPSGKKGYKLTQEQRERVRKAHLGIKLTEEHRKNISKALKKQWKNGVKRTGMLGKKHSKETREKMSFAQKGEKSYMWKGGVSPINKIIRKSVKFKLWRESVFKRDDYTCQQCKIRGGILHPDHIKPFALFPELRFNLDNGQTLCINCHKKTKTWGRH